ncbi:hypothetical protein ACLOJK_033643 [Asimina triloba]
MVPGLLLLVIASQDTHGSIMFSLRIHSIEKRPGDGDGDGDGHGSPSCGRPLHSFGPEIHETRGIIHLYRDVSLHPHQPLPASRSTLLFVIAIPSRMSTEDFLHFCVTYDDAWRDCRNDGMDDRYSMLIQLADQKNADNFYPSLSGRRFPSTEAEVCHILFTASVEYTDSAEIAATPPNGSTELPTCPVCIGQFLCLAPLTLDFLYLTAYSSCPVCRFCQQQPEKPTCSVCETSENLWICVICGFVGCGRYKEGHAVRHWRDTQHCYSLDLETQRVWDYVGDSYVHRLNLSKADGKLVKLNSHCTSTVDDCGACECSGDSGISGALLSSKVDAIVDEYNHLLASQLENQRQYYESLLAEAKGKREKSISEVVEKAVDSKLQSIQLEFEKCIEEKAFVSNINENLMKNQDLWRKRIKEIEERYMNEEKEEICDWSDESKVEQVGNGEEYWPSSGHITCGPYPIVTVAKLGMGLNMGRGITSYGPMACLEGKSAKYDFFDMQVNVVGGWMERAALRSRDEKIVDLEEQIRDLSVYIEAQKTLNTMADADDIRGGTLLPVPLHQSSPANSKKCAKANRRRS